MPTPSRHHRTVLALLSVAVLATAACGSKLSEDEVLARSAVGNDAVDATLGLPTASSTTTLVADANTTQTGPKTASPQATNDSAGAPVPTGPSAGPDAGPTTPTPSDDAPCTSTESGPLVIGNVGNYSGPAGVAVGDMPRGLQLWAAMINSRGGLCGREVQVIVQDDGGDPARYGSLTRELVESRGIVSFVGNGAPLSAQGGLAYHRSSGVPVIGTDCTTGFWFDSPVLFPPCTTPTGALTGAVANGVALTGETAFGYLYCTEAQGCLDADRIFREGAVKDAGASIAYRKSISITQVDFTAECQAASKEGVKLFYVGADPATLQRVTQSCARQNFFPRYISVSVTWSPTSLATRGLEDVALAMATFPFDAASGGAIDEYNGAVDAFAPGTKKSPALALGWTAGKLFEEAVTRVVRGGDSVTPKTLIQALQGFQDEDLGGLTTPLNFGPNGAENRNCHFTMQGDGSGTAYSLPNGSKPVCR